MVTSTRYNDYMVYPNESIDKLTVNRVLGRLHSLIGKITNGETDIVVTTATSSTYGTVKRNIAEEYEYRMAHQEKYYYKTLSINQLKDYANKEYMNGNMYDFYRVKDDESHAIRTSIGDCSYLNMPNGVNLLVLSFDIGVNNLTRVFSSSVVSASVDVPVLVSGYELEFPLDKTSMTTIGSVYGDDTTSHPITSLFGNLSSNAIHSTYLNQMGMSIHHHRCNYLSYQSYHRSCIEITFSTEMSINDVYGGYYNFCTETTVDSSDYTRDMQTNYDTFPKEFKPFQSKPVIIPQLVFYNTNSSPDATFGGYNDFIGGNDGELGKTTLTNSGSVTDGDVSHEISPFDGFVLLKSFTNVYKSNGDVRDNIIVFDVVMRFIAGDADDCNLEEVMRSINAKARVQLMMMGI